MQPSAFASSTLMSTVNSSRILWGLSTVVMQLGARSVVGELTEMQTKMLSSRATKMLAIFAMVFVATRDVGVAAAMATAIYATLEWLLNENSSLCVVPRSSRPAAAAVTPAEYAAALNVVRSYRAQVHQEPRVQRGQDVRRVVLPPRLIPPIRTNLGYDAVR